MITRGWTTVLLFLSIFAIAGSPVVAGPKKVAKQYQALCGEADALWAEYKKADKNFFEKGKTGIDDHIKTLARLQDKLAALHTKWLNTEAPDAVGTSDFKIGLALELQMAAIGAEIVGLLEDDQDYMNLSMELDKQYEAVVQDL